IESVTDAGEVTWAPRDANELDSMRELVASAIGFDDARGDSITIRSMQFQPFPLPPAPLPVGLLDRLAFDVMSLVQLAVLAAVSLILGLLVVRPLLAGGQGRPAVAQLAAPSEGNTGSNATIPLAHIGETLTDGTDLEVTGLQSGPLAIADNREEPAERLRRLIEDRKDETVEVLARWMQDQPEQAR
ncbi:MAG: flagellar M-ring protein FliF C-terminal domain-containing protein, partial [Boseongicola sp.]